MSQRDCLKRIDKAGAFGAACVSADSSMEVSLYTASEIIDETKWETTTSGAVDLAPEISELYPHYNLGPLQIFMQILNIF